MCVEKALSITLRSSSRAPRSRTMSWRPGTTIFTCVVVSMNLGCAWKVLSVYPPDPPSTGDPEPDASPGRPREGAPAEDVEVQMGHALPRLGTDVRNESVSGADTVSVGNLPHRSEHLSQQGPVVVAQLMRRTDVALGDDENMCGGDGA